MLYHQQPFEGFMSNRNREKANKLEKMPLLQQLFI